MDALQPIVIICFIFWTFYRIIELFVHRRERLQIIEKLDPNDLAARLGDLDASLRPRDPARTGFTMLRIGLLVMGLGIGMVIAGVLRAYSDCMHWNWPVYQAFSGGVVMLCTALFALIGYAIEYRMIRKHRKQE